MAQPAMDPTVYCSVYARERGEPLTGTATQVQHWLLLEYNAPWRRKATDDNNLPRPVQDWLQAQAAALPMGRVQFIRQRGRSAGELSFYLVQANDESGQAYRLGFERYEELLDLDLAALLAGEGALAGWEPVTEPLLLVCTNARRDRCCGLYGAALYRALAGPTVWQTTHLGGHRFAPVVLSLPDSYLYGRLLPDEAPAFVDTLRQGKVALPYLRGRTLYDDVVQAAELLLRQDTGETARDAYRWMMAGQLAGNEWLVQFQERQSSRLHHLHLRRTASQEPIYASCGKLETKTLYQYARVDRPESG